MDDNGVLSVAKKSVKLPFQTTAPPCLITKSRTSPKLSEFNSLLVSVKTSCAKSVLLVTFTKRVTDEPGKKLFSLKSGEFSNSTDKLPIAAATGADIAETELPTNTKAAKKPKNFIFLILNQSELPLALAQSNRAPPSALKPAPAPI